MGLDEQLCRKAKDLHGWEMKFAGEYRTHSRVEISEWATASEHPAVAISIERIKSLPTYGFVNADRQDVFLYQPFAVVYPGRANDFQEDLMRAALLHLRQEISGKPAEITFPSSLQVFVRSYHLGLLEPNNLEVHHFSGGIIPIYRSGTLEGVTEVLDSLKIKDISPV